MATKYIKGISSSPEANLSDIMKRGSYWACSDAVTYASTSDTLFAHPAYTTILAVVAEVTTAFTTVTSIEIGDGTTTNLFASFGGCLRDTGKYPVWCFERLTDADTIVATVNGAASAGSVKFWVCYQPNNNEQRIFTR
jgi:hypothetical protein